MKLLISISLATSDTESYGQISHSSEGKLLEEVKQKAK